MGWGVGGGGGSIKDVRERVCPLLFVLVLWVLAKNFILILLKKFLLYHKN